MHTKPLSLLAATLVAVSLFVAPPQPVGANPPIPAQQVADLGPVETLQFMAENLANKRADVVWALLPASYQTEITSLVHEFAASADADVYQQSANLLKKLVRLLQEKKDFILGSPLVAEMAGKSREEIEPAYNAGIELFATLVNSEFGDLDRLKTVDLGQMLAETGGSLMGQIETISALMDEGDPFAQFKKPAFELLDQDGDNATIKITTLEDHDGEPVEETTEVSLVRIEGKWVESEMAGSFEESLKEARDAIGEFDWQDGRMAALTFISGIDNTLDELLATATPEEFNASVMALLGGFMGEIPDQE